MRRHRMITGGALLLCLVLIAGSTWAVAHPHPLPAGVVRLVPVAHDAVDVNLALDTQTHRVVVQSGDVSHSGTLNLLDAATGRTLQAVPIGAYPAGQVLVDERRGRAFALTFGLNPATGRLGPGRLYVLDTHSGRLVFTAPAGVAPALGVDTTAGRLFLTSPASGKPGTGGLQMRDVTTGRLLRAIPSSGDRIVIDNTAARAFVIDTQANRISLVDTHSGRLLRTIAAGGNTSAARVDERTGRLFIGEASRWTCGVRPVCQFNGPSQLVVLDTRTGRVVRALTAGVTNPAAIAITTRAQHVFVFYTNMTTGRGAAGALRVLDARTGRVLRTLPVAVAPTEGQVAVDERRGRVYAVDAAGTSVFDATTGALLRTIATPGDAIVVDALTGHALVVHRWEPHPAFIDLTHVLEALHARVSGHWTATSSARAGQMPGTLAVIDASP